MLSPVRLPVVCLSVTLVTPYSGCRNFLSIFLRHLVRWPSADIQEKVHGDRPIGTTPSGELNTTRLAKYSDFGPIEGYVSETAQDRR